MSQQQIPAPIPFPIMPAVEANSFLARGTNREIRIVFAQQFIKDEPMMPVAAVKMTIANAQWLVDHLQKVIDEAEALPQG